jgi:hypothetical protein
METNVAFAQRRMAMKLGGRGGPSSALQVRWTETTGGQVDAVTGALIGGEEREVSGTLRGCVHETEAKSVIRQMAEIQVGDLLLDLSPLARVTRYADGLEVSLESLQDQGVRFEHPMGSGRWYMQANVGERLAQAWRVTVGDQELVRTMLLRKAT